MIAITLCCNKPGYCCVSPTRVNAQLQLAVAAVVLHNLCRARSSRWLSLLLCRARSSRWLSLLLCRARSSRRLSLLLSRARSSRWLSLLLCRARSSPWLSLLLCRARSSRWLSLLSLAHFGSSLEPQGKVSCGKILASSIYCSFLLRRLLQRFLVLRRALPQRMLFLLLPLLRKLWTPRKAGA